MLIMQPGDLVFYRSQGRLYERVIERATNGPWVHVAVATGHVAIIAAETQGIVREFISPNDNPALTLLHLSPASAQAGKDAFAWLSSQVGKKYGWGDILSQGMKLLGLPVYLGTPGALDCSDLAASFAAQYTLDQTLMRQVIDQRQLISPNDLARYYGLPMK